MAPKSSLSIRLWIVEGLLDKNTWVQDCNFLRIGLNWFAEKKCFVQCRSIYLFDRGKLVILSVFIKFHLFETIVRHRSQVIKVVRRTRNGPGKLTTLSMVSSSFKQIFKISV